MSPRRQRRGPDPQRPAASRPELLGLRTEDGPDGQPWQVRPVSGARAEKTYRCPGCDHEVRPGTPHVVAWPEGQQAERRHWHTGCWHRRSPRRH